MAVWVLTFIISNQIFNLKNNIKMKKQFLLAIGTIICSYNYAQIIVNSNGNVGIGDVDSAETVLEIKGSEDTSYFYKGTNEDVIIKAGKSAGDITIDGDDITIGHSGTFSDCYDYSSVKINGDLEIEFSYEGGGPGCYHPSLSFFASDDDMACIAPGSSGDGELGVSWQYWYNTYTTNIYRNNEYSLSDERFKTNIVPIPSPLSIIMQLDGKKYDYKREAYKTDNEERANDLVEKGKDNFGFIAQELVQFLPQLVTQDDSGTYYVSTQQLIPILVEALKEQQAQISSLQEQLNNSSSKLKSLESKEDNSSVENTSSLQDNDATLYQNNPNPFNQQTEIRCFIPETTKTANIYIYDMNGQQVANYSLDSYGDTKIIIDGSDLSAGMYMYTLIVDGVSVDTKQMILTQ